MIEKTTQNNTMQNNFFTPLANTKPYFKAALQGFAGSGKTYTAALIAVGLYQRIASTKPVIILDTEKAAKFLKPLFAKNNIEVLVKESRSLADLRETMSYMRAGQSDILIIDSISHIWENFLQSYAEKVKGTRLQFQDWGIIKPTWKAEFSDPFVRDPYHIIMCGRAGYEYENEINPDTKVREIYKSGIKMKVEGETAYEPDMLVLMERFEQVLGNDKKVWREATVLKDRSTLLDGKTFQNPNYQDFAASIEAMMADPSTVKPAQEGNAGLLFRTEEEKGEWKREKEKALEEIEGLLTSVAPGQSSTEKKFKVDILFEIFGTTSWEAIKQISSNELKGGYDMIRAKCVDMGLAAYRPDQTIATIKKVEVKNDVKIDAQVTETIKKSKSKR